MFEPLWCLGSLHCAMAPVLSHYILTGFTLPVSHCVLKKTYRVKSLLQKHHWQKLILLPCYAFLHHVVPTDSFIIHVKMNPPVHFLAYLSHCKSGLSYPLIDRSELL
eukprot:TRINITY_DN10907_c0_g1_i1.p1 TRINITY_DN10907_c0_g1~~TRINITY_DN10907_c0_g1_i1.p1  ORF type:complete len:107 (-),score=8.22 TRINITY_DN10907_c0_g1_i1:988-1308(-)